MEVANEVGGIKMLLLCPQLLDRSSHPKEIAEKFANNPAILGYFLKNELFVKNFEYLADLSKRIESGDGKHFCYVNLNPILHHQPFLERDHTMIITPLCLMPVGN